MNAKKFAAIAFALLSTFSLNACTKSTEASVPQESTTFSDTVAYETVLETVLNTEPILSDTTTEYYIQETSQQVYSAPTETTTQPETTTTQVFDDPADWSIKRIVEEYKIAAEKTNSSAKSTQKISIKEMSVNDGEYENAMSFIKTIISKFLESNSTEKNGITGGFQNLVPADINTAKAYKSNSDTIIEMTLKEQTSGPKEDALSGSVGHAITTVGDISVVVKDLSDRGLPLELSEEDTKIYYTSPQVKVTINENGEIISGTWSYTVEISMNNFKAFGQTVEKAKIVMDNTITM